MWQAGGYISLCPLQAYFFLRLVLLRDRISKYFHERPLAPYTTFAYAVLDTYESTHLLFKQSWQKLPAYLFHFSSSSLSRKEVRHMHTGLQYIRKRRCGLDQVHLH